MKNILATVAVIALLSPTANAALTAPVLHATLDNVDVGAGAGTDTTAAGAFEVRDIAGAPENGLAEDVLNLGATASAHVTSGAAGQINEALSFPTSQSSNRGVQFGDVHDIGTGDYSVSVWFNADDTSGTESVASKGNLSSGSEGWHIFKEGGNVFARLGLGGTGALDRASMSDAFSAGVWNHVALVVDNQAGQVLGYLNGALMANTGGGGPGDNLFTAGTDISTAAPVRLAVSATGTLEFQGELDDFAIFGQALSAAQIAQIHDGGLAGVNAADAVFTPEPATAMLLALGAAATLRRRRA